VTATQHTIYIDPRVLFNEFLKKNDSKT
jgi:hypothetical protein